MRLTELKCRGSQEAFKWMERVRPGALTETVRQDPNAFDRFVRNSDQHFFQGPGDRRMPAALAFHAADHCTQSLAMANEICRGRFDLLGYCNLDFGDPIDWHLDPVSGRRAPLRHWTRIDPSDYASLGDAKVICELNRHQWFVQLGQAYRLTREKRYAQNLVRYLEAWLRDNPAGMGINWTSSLELALRVIAWSWALVLISDSGAMSPSLFAAVVESVNAHATHIERYLSYYFSPNTHLTGEALGLLYAGILFPQLEGAERWRSIGTRILIDEIERQVLADGVYFERATCYQRYTVETYLHLMILGQRSGIALPAIIGERVKSMLDFLVSVSRPDGSMPSIGDMDGGDLLPLSRNDPQDIRASFSTAAVLFQEPTYAWAAGGLAPETLWLLGASALETFEALRASPPPESESCRVFPEGGFAVMRSGWDRDSHALIFDTGPLGCPVSGGHGHADLLSIQCTIFGQPFLVDAGTCCYAANNELRDFFRGTAAHSSVMVDREDQAKPAGPFAWQSRPAGQLLCWTSNATLAFADAEHDGYRTLADPVTHRRRVIFVKPRYWIILDDLTGAAPHHVEFRFQFAPMDIRIGNSGWTRATLDGECGVLVRAFTTTRLEAEVREGRRSPLEGWVSPDYGQAEPAPALVYSAATQLPMQVATLIWATERLHEDAPRVDLIQDTRGGIAGLVFIDLAETILFESSGPRIVRSGVPKYGEAVAS
jgi:hypothetical protein